MPNRQIAQGVFEIWKERSETLAALLLRFRKEGNVGVEVPITYAGRLDPMAEGLVILLVGDARFRKEEYLSKGKRYAFEVLFGISTDTYDVLGRIEKTLFEKIPEEKIVSAVEGVKNTALPYPPYSSKPVDGTPLFALAREGELPDELPLQQGAIDHISFKEMKTTSLRELVPSIISDIQKVEGDFRQRDIANGWQEVLRNNPEAEVVVASFEADVSSGTYIRSIAHQMGIKVGVPSLAYSIVRTNLR